MKTFFKFLRSSPTGIDLKKSEMDFAKHFESQYLFSLEQVLSPAAAYFILFHDWKNIYIKVLLLFVPQLNAGRSIKTVNLAF